MNIALLQLDIQWKNLSANIHRAEQLIDGVQKADLYVLPEMWTTGFVMEPAGIAEEESASKALAWMKTQSEMRQCAICGSLAVRIEDGTFRNRLYFITPDKTYFYDKRHLFSMGGEDKRYERGVAHAIAEWKGVRFLLLTCYDLRFPVWSRYGIAGEYDAIIYTANWPQSRQTVWDTLIRARAIENQCYVVAVNRVGDDTKCHYEGGSALVDPRGHVTESCIKNTEQSLMTTLSIEELQNFRLRFRVLDDRDNQSII